MNPRLYEATSDEFPDLLLAFKEPDNQFAISSYYAFKSIKFPKKTNVWFSKNRQMSGFQVHFKHIFRRITSKQVDIFLRELDTF